MLSLLLALACADRTEVIQGTTAARSDAVELHAGGLVAREREAGVAFGSVRLARGKRAPAYVLILDHRLGGEGKSEFADSASADENKAEAKQTITIDGHTLELEYRLALEPRTRKLVKESLTLNDKAIDLTRGRVFLVDLRSSPPRWEQVKVELPAEVDAATAKKSASTLAATLLAHLRGKDRRVKEFAAAGEK